MTRERAEALAIAAMDAFESGPRLDVRSHIADALMQAASEEREAEQTGIALRVDELAKAHDSCGCGIADDIIAAIRGRG